MIRRPPRSTLFPYTTLFRSLFRRWEFDAVLFLPIADGGLDGVFRKHRAVDLHRWERQLAQDRKSTRLNSSHGYISYAVFCLKKKNTGCARSTFCRSVNSATF